MNVTAIFITIVLIGTFFVYIKPKMDVFNGLRNNPQFSHYILIIESNAEFDQRSFEKFMKHMKLFLMYYSQSFNDTSTVSKMKNQHNNIIKYLNRMLMAVPNSMQRYNYMKYAIDNMNIVLKSYIDSASKRHDLPYVNI